MVNGLIVANVSASDPDIGDSLTYALLDDAGGRFTLVGSQLSITDASLFDYTTQANHTVTLKTTDANGLSLTKDFNISLERHPDLVVTQIDGPQSAHLGERIQFSWVDSNQGRAAINGSWTDKIYLDDPNTSELDRLVGDFIFTGNMSVGGTIERIQTLTLPGDLPSGDYRFVVVTDANNSVNEGATGEANNTTGTQVIHVSPEVKPNLQVGTITAPTTAFTGHSIEVQWTVTNAGTAATSIPVWNDGLYLSADNVFDSSDIYLGSATNAAYLDIGQTYSNSATVTLPKLEGDYHILVVADRNGHVSEGSKENDNVRASATLTIQPIPIAELSDLAVISVAAPAQAFSGQRVNLTYTIDNAGQAAIAGDIKFPEWVEQIYMSKDDVLDSSDTLLQTIIRDLYYQAVVWVDLPFHNLLGGGVGGNGIESPINSSEPQGYYIWVDDPNAVGIYGVAGSAGGIGGTSPTDTSSTQKHGYYKYGYYKYETVNNLPQANNATHFTTTESVTLPVGESGDFTFFVRVIPVGSVSNVFASNDVAFDSTATVVHLTPPPDLKTGSVTVSGTALAGHAINLSYQVSNKGLSSTPNTNWIDTVYLSTDNVLDANDIKLTDLNHSGALQPNETYSNNATLTLPNGITGNYYLIVSNDSKNEIFEQDNANNIVSSTAITIDSQPADLLVNAVTLPSTSLAGKSVLISWQVSNQGIGDSIASVWDDAIIASSDAIIGNADDVLLATFAHQGVLNPGEHYSRSDLVILPSSLSGNYSIFAVTDFNNQVFEANQENNNAIAASNQLLVLPNPSDLQVSSVSSPVTAESGKAINIAYTVNNLANKTEANHWTDTIILSTDTVLGNADDIVLNTIDHYGSLDFNQAYSVNRNFTLPNDLQGTFNVFVTTDVNQRVNESALSNNSSQAANAVTVALSSMPDLVINTLEAANQAVSGQNLALSWTVQNNGAATGQGYRTVFYLSPDQILDRDSDIYLGFDNSANLLTNGATVNASTNLHIPNGLSGSYQVFAVVDSSNAIYERDGENNNVTRDSTPVAISLPLLTDLVAGTITVPQTNVLGQQAGITYTVSNQSADNLNSSWQDSVYLSLDNVWDVRDVLFARVDISKSLNAGDSYTQTVSGQFPGLAIGDYQVIVRSDIRNVIAESNEANNLKASVDAVVIDVEQLTLGTAANGNIGTANSVYYRVDVAAGETLKVAFDSASSTGRTEFFISHGDMPSRANFDYRYTVADSPDQSITIPNTQAGTYFILAYNAEGAASNYTITADTLHFGIEDLSLHQGSNKGQVTVRIDGAEFTTHTNAQLVGSDGVAHTAHQLVWKDGSELWATFDLRGMAIGAYDVKLTDGTQTTLLNDGFNVISGTVGHVEYGMETPPALRAIRGGSSSEQGTVRVYYKNTGDTDVAAPLLTVSGNALLKLPQDTQFTANSMQFLGVGSEGPAGTLAPGSEGSFELIFKADFAGSGTVNLGVSSLATNETMDWASILENSKPAGIDAASWEKIKANLIAELGSTTGDYQTALDKNATQLDALEGRTNSVEDLFNMAFLRATNNGALLQDAEIGELGRGRSFDWDITATQQDNGDVLVTIGGVQQRFILQTNGSYTSDGTSTLNKQNGVFTLNQLDGGKIAFNADGTFNAIIDSNGNALQASYNATGQLSQVSSEFGDSQTFTYNPQGRLASITDQNGQVTTYSYDANAEYLTDITTQNGTTHYAYVGTGSTQQISSITLPNGTVQHFEYNSAGRLVKESVNTDQQVTTYEYVGVNEVLVTDSLGQTNHLWLNDRGQIAQVENALGQITQLRYDANGNLTATVNPDGTVSQLTYDANNNPLSVQDALGHSVNFSYNPQNGQLANVTDQRGNPLSYSYDAHGNLNRISYADGSSEQYSYNEDGNVTGMVNRRGDGISYSYNAKGQLLQKTYPDGSKATLSYDAHGNLTLATDADSSSSFEYDSYDRLIKTTDGDGRWLSYSYDSVGRKIQMADSTGHTTNYSYNNQGQLARLSDASDHTIANYQYDDNGRLSRGDNGNGTYTTYEYDAAGQLTHLINYKADASINSRFDYTYNEVGLRTSMNTLDGTTHYSYDATGQLTGVTLPDSRHIDYRYDAAGNRITVSDNGVDTHYTTNALNEYTDVGNATYAYDQDGNLSSKTEGGITTTFGYDAENHLISVSNPSDTWQYEYDALGGCPKTPANNGIIATYT